MADAPELFDELDPPPRLMMGPGPINAEPRVLRAMSMPLLGQFDPAFTRYMDEVMRLLRQLFRTENRWAFLVDGTARAGIETILTSLIEPGDKVLVPVFGRFGHLLCEIAERSGASLATIETEWGTVFEASRIEAAIREHRPKVVALVHGDTSTTMAQPLDEIGPLCRRYGALLYVDATATVGGMDLDVDAWMLDAVSVGLQKCLSGPPGCAPITFNTRVEEAVLRRKRIERGLAPQDGARLSGAARGTQDGAPADGAPIQSNYFDLPMLMDYWSEDRLNHHTEATSMLYAARECVRIALREGLSPRIARHALASRALTAGLRAMDLGLFGDQDHKMANATGVVIPARVDGEQVRGRMLDDFGIEIGTSFGPLKGRIWRIGTMGYNCRKQNVLACLAALDATLRQGGHACAPGAGVDAALGVYRAAGQ